MKCYGCNEEIEVGDFVLQIEVVSWNGTHKHECHRRCGLTLIGFNGKLFTKICHVED